MRLIWLGVNVLFWTLLVSILAILVGLVDRSGRGIHFMGSVWSKIILFVAGIPYELKGKEFLDSKQQYIFAGNHESALDIPLCFAAIPHLIVPLAKKELLKIPFFGLGMYLAGHIFVDRKNHERALKSLEKASQSIVNHPRSILIYPEGTRSLDGEIHKFKKGAAVMAISLGFPIVPMAMCGTGNVKRKGSWDIKLQKIELRMGKPIDTSSYKYDDRNRLTDDLQRAVVELKKDWLSEQQG